MNLECLIQFVPRSIIDKITSAQKSMFGLAAHQITCLTCLKCRPARPLLPIDASVSATGATIHASIDAKLQ